tara:strand:- start:1844 stop:3979 length:2136 start_codon:yes stop_codon:yes gene_type:complete
VTERQTYQNKEGSEVKTVSVPFPLGKMEENISISTNDSNKPSKEQLINQAIKFHSQGKIIEASKLYESFINQGFTSERVFSNYGDILRNIGKIKEAEIFTRKAIKLKPDCSNSHSNLGGILRDLGKLKEAELSTRKAIQFKPNNVKAHFNLGVILTDLGKLEEAELSIRKAIDLKPDFAYAHFNLGNILKALGKLTEAELSTYKAIELKPDFAKAYTYLAGIMRDLGKEKDAVKYYSLALGKQPNNIYFYISAKLNFSKIMRDSKQIEIERKNYKEELDRLKNNKNIYYKNGELFNTKIFYLPYHNRPDDKIILEELSNTLSEIDGVVVNNDLIEKKRYSSSQNNHLKVGVCSEFLRFSHVVGKLYIKVLLDLLKTDLEIIIYIPPGTKQYNNNETLINSFKKVIDLPNSPVDAQKVIMNDNLDILFYPDIGMSSYTYFVALSRLALVQVNSIGHTNTSGLSTMDYFITSYIEPSTSDESYTEHLVRFSRLPFNYSKPIIDENKITIRDINISSENYFNIGLTQTLFKFHPNYDEILEKILKKIKNARLILIKDKSSSVTEALKDRWRRNHKLLIERSIFLNYMSNNDFLYVIKCCDIMLDPFYYGSGNTFYESMAFGIPFITYEKQKSKIPIAGYKQMKVENPPIALSIEEYLNWCVYYANNKNILSRTRTDLRERANKYLFNDQTIYKEYYEFFKDAVRNAKSGKKLES